MISLKWRASSKSMLLKMVTSTAVRYAFTFLVSVSKFSWTSGICVLSSQFYADLKQFANISKYYSNFRPTNAFAIAVSWPRKKPWTIFLSMLENLWAFRNLSRWGSLRSSLFERILPTFFMLSQAVSEYSEKQKHGSVAAPITAETRVCPRFPFPNQSFCWFRA